MDVAEQLRTLLGERYLIDREIGAGGMATVYLAEDLKHHRKVALKILRPELATLLGPERFLSEINLTASLQHPHLLPLFDSGEVGGLLYYVMPYVEGESLRSRLDRERQLPVVEAVRIAIAVASALDYAHRHGVIHRDIKPENILLQDGQPLVADFGIALAISHAGDARVTGKTLSLGTPAYMSPEQATGDKWIDARSDIYSLAAVVHEMLVGAPPHVASSVQALIAKIIADRVPSVRAHRESVPQHVDAALMRALAKLPADRFATASEFGEALSGARAIVAQSASVAPAEADRTRRFRRQRLTAGAPWFLFAAALVFIIARAAAPGGHTPQRTLFELNFPDSVRPVTPDNGVEVAISPDGSQLAFLGRGPAGQGIYLRPLDALRTTFVRGTEGGDVPRFSPDGSHLLFRADNELKKVPVGGGTPITVAADSAISGNARWSDRNEILYGFGGKLWRVSAAGGGTPTAFARLDSLRDHRRYAAPFPLPGGEFALITLWKADVAQKNAELGVVRLRDGRVSELGIHGMNPLHVNGYVVFGRTDGRAYAAPFSRRRMQFTGPPVPVLEDVMVKTGGMVEMSLSETALLVHKGKAVSTVPLLQVRRAGSMHTLMLIPSPTSPRLDPAGRRVAVEVDDGGGVDISTYDLVSKGRLRVTTDGKSRRPEWTPNGQRIVYMVDRFALDLRPSDGSGAAERLLSTGNLDIRDISVGRLGSFIAVTAFLPDSWQRGAGNGDIWIAPADSPNALRPFLTSRFNESHPRVSPNGALLAYQGNESGRQEIYIRPLSGTGSRIPVSTEGGVEPVWSHSGQELYYRGPTHVMSAVIATTPQLRVLQRDTLFPDQFARFDARANYDVFPDGGGFVFFGKPTQEHATIRVLTNWVRGLKHSR